MQPHRYVRKDRICRNKIYLVSLLKRILDFMEGYIVKSLEDILNRIERLNNLIKIHKNQSNPDVLAIEGYQRLKFQYSNQIKDLLYEFEIDVEINNQLA
jgi:hypothetical protein